MPAKFNAKFAETIMIQAGLQPLAQYETSKARWKCKCLTCNKVVYPTLHSVRAGQNGCKYCANLQKKQILLVPSEIAEAVMLRASLEPLEKYPGASIKWKCKCLTCGEIVYPKYNMIYHGQGGCRKCGYIKRSKKLGKLYSGKNLSSSKRPHITEEQAVLIAKEIGRIPLEPFSSAKAKWKSKCIICGTVGFPPLSLLKQRGNSCKTCGRIRTNDSKKLEKSAVREAFTRAGLELLEEYQHNNSQPLKCRCLTCGKIVSPTYANVRKRKNGCKFCSKKSVDAAEAKNFMRLMGYEPIDSYSGSDVRWKVRHIKCGNITYPTYGTIKSGGGGCKHCADWGFSYRKKSYLYLLTHSGFQAHKIGIANEAKLVKSDRVHRHKNNGWDVFRIWNFDNGLSVFKIEAEVFRVLRNELQIPQFLLKGQMKYQGETETVAADLISLLELEKIITKAIRKLKLKPVDYKKFNFKPS